MVMPAPHTVWTAEMVRALPDDGQRYEVLDGALFVSPAPSAIHQRAVFRLASILDEYTNAHGVGETMISPADIQLSEQRVLQPDVFVVPTNDGGLIRSWREITTLVLSVEVISQATERADRVEKRIILQEERIPEYWIVDVDQRLVERWRPDDAQPAIDRESLLWQPRAGVPPLEIELVRYFAKVSLRP